MRGKIPAALALAATLALAAGTAGGGIAGTANVCKLVPAAVTQALGGAPSSAKASSSPAPGGSMRTCAYARGGVQLRVIVGPKAIYSNGFGGPPGMVVKKPAGFGAQAREAYDLSSKFQFASVDFVKGSSYGSVWSNKLPLGKVLAVGHALYKALH